MGRQRRDERQQRSPQSTGSTGTLRVIGGRLRGRKIAYLGDPRTRPMKQRVREASFNLLGKRVANTHVIDLFAGTGALAWEAMSRGATTATLIERHFPSARVIRENAAALQLTEVTDVVAGDTFYWARKLDPQTVAPEPNRPWLVFCSPPYELYVSDQVEMLRLINQLLGAAPPGSLILVESDRRFDTDSLPTQVVWDVREYPPAVLALAEKPVDTPVD